jgi:hypothetical protein
MTIIEQASSGDFEHICALDETVRWARYTALELIECETRDGFHTSFGRG